MTQKVSECKSLSCSTCAHSVVSSRLVFPSTCVLGTGLRGAVALLFGRRRVHHVVVALGGRLAGQRRQLVVRMPVAHDGRFARLDELGGAETRHRILGLGGTGKDVLLGGGGCGSESGRVTNTRRTAVGSGAHFRVFGHNEGTRLLEQRPIVHQRGNQREVEVFALLAQCFDVDGGVCAQRAKVKVRVLLSDLRLQFCARSGRFRRGRFRGYCKKGKESVLKG